jgi:hypothetical protein
MKQEYRAVIDWYLDRMRNDDPDRIRMRPQYDWDDKSRGAMAGDEVSGRGPDDDAALFEGGGVER